MSVQDLDFAKLSISHEEPTDNAHWTAILKDKNDPGFSFDLTKILVFKPKTNKSDADKAPAAVVVVALADSVTPSGAVAKAAGVKEVRLAKPELIAELFNDSKASDIGALAVTAENISKLKLLVDSKLAKSSRKLAVHPDKSSVTVFVEGTKLVEYYQGLGEVELVDFAASDAQNGAKNAPNTSKTAPNTSKSAPKSSSTVAADDNKDEKQITADKESDFPGWYSQILTKGEMISYYTVSGCFILRPKTMFVWNQIHKFFDDRITSIGVQEAYFPLFVPKAVLEKEKDHIEGFAPEVAWVTKAGSSDLEEHLAIRPTSETVMYPYYAKWIRSHRDLPFKLNQWNSVVRMEFKHPQPFLRTREFLWQEGHTAHLTAEGAEEEVLQILKWYEAVYTDLLAVPMVPGKKTDKEKFAGADFTTTVEGYIAQTGRGIQGATSHFLGQNFSKMFGITVQDPNDNTSKIPVWQNSWGLSTRCIGVMIMVHSDQKGLVLPPRVADVQIMIIPVGIKASTSSDVRDKLYQTAEELTTKLKSAGLRAKWDDRENYTPGWKFSDAELQGIPIRLELGPLDLEKNQVIAVRRDNGEKAALSLDGLSENLYTLMDDIHNSLYNKAKKQFDEHRVPVSTLDEMVENLNQKNLCLAPFCGAEDCEDSIKDRTGRQPDDVVVDEKAPSMGAKTLCIPFALQDKLKEGDVCIGCGKPAKYYTMFGRSY